MNETTDAVGGSDRSAWLVSGVGVALACTVVGEWVYFLFAAPGDLVVEQMTLQVAVNLLPALGIVGAGAWLRRSDVGPDRYGRIAAWCLGGLASFLLINLAIIAFYPPEPFVLAIGWARTVAIFGAFGGAGFGIVEARAIERGRAAERARTKQRRAEREHEFLEFLNRLLRHEVLNTATVIEGQASYALDHANRIDGDRDGEGSHGDSERRGEDANDVRRETLATIRRRNRKMADVIRDVRTLIDAAQGADEFDRVDVGAALEAEVADLCDRNPDVAVETSVDDGLVVRADDLLSRVFWNLLVNAVEHNDAETPRIRVTAERRDGSVAVEIADNGPGIPESELGDLFERPTGGDHGLGLYLVRSLAERYGGTVELSESDPDGSVFVVELPAAAAEEDGRWDGERAPRSAVTGPESDGAEVPPSMTDGADSGDSASGGDGT